MDIKKGDILKIDELIQTEKGKQNSYVYISEHYYLVTGTEKGNILRQGKAYQYDLELLALDGIHGPQTNIPENSIIIPKEVNSNRDAIDDYISGQEIILCKKENIKSASVKGHIDLSEGTEIRRIKRKIERYTEKLKRNRKYNLENAKENGEITWRNNENIFKKLAIDEKLDSIFEKYKEIARNENKEIPSLWREKKRYVRKKYAFPAEFKTAAENYIDNILKSLPEEADYLYDDLKNNREIRKSITSELRENIIDKLSNEKQEQEKIEYFRNNNYFTRKEKNMLNRYPLKQMIKKARTLENKKRCRFNKSFDKNKIRNKKKREKIFRNESNKTDLKDIGKRIKEISESVKQPSHKKETISEKEIRGTGYYTENEIRSLLKLHGDKRRKSAKKLELAKRTETYKEAKKYGCTKKEQRTMFEKIAPITDLKDIAKAIKIETGNKKKNNKQIQKNKHNKKEHEK